jgi:hypothetical protein
MDYFLVYHRAKQRAKLRNGNMDHFTFIDRTPFEKIHLIFCKHLLGTKKTSSNIGVKAELGRLPVENFINSQAILYLGQTTYWLINYKISYKHYVLFLFV